MAKATIKQSKSNIKQSKTFVKQSNSTIKQTKSNSLDSSNSGRATGSNASLVNAATMNNMARPTGGLSKINLIAPSDSQVQGYAISVGPKVNTNEVLVHDNAQSLHDAMCENYNKINTYFQAIGDAFNEAAGYVVGTNFKNSLKKIGTNCKNQGQYCLKRKSDLEKSFEYQVTNAKVSDLEQTVHAMQEEINTLKAQLDAANLK